MITIAYIIGYLLIGLVCTYICARFRWIDKDDSGYTLFAWILIPLVLIWVLSEWIAKVGQKHSGK